MALMANTFVHSESGYCSKTLTQGPAQCLEFLCIIYDTVGMLATVSAERRAKTAAKISALLASSSTDD